ncbi:MAG: biopolymer transporter ExbD [Actinobacteria bacterium]|nr:biopolymer transporter ExbD [Actinomycetota bacterium]
MTGSRDDGLDATRKLPAMPTAGYQTDAFTDPYGVAAPPKVRRHKWLFPLAGAVLILALCMVIAMVIVDSSEQQTLVAPPPLPAPTQDPMSSSTTVTTTTTPESGEPSEAVSPPAAAAPSDPESGDTEAVLYSVIGNGRAVSITYVDTGGGHVDQMTIDQLPARLHDIAVVQPDNLVYIRADKGAVFDKVRDLLKIAAQAGFYKVSLMSQAQQ